MAVRITIRRGIAAKRANSPISNKKPQMISVAPTNGTKKCGWGMPIFVNRSKFAPDIRSFWSPSDKNTNPTISRTRIFPGKFANGNFFIFASF